MDIARFKKLYRKFSKPLSFQEMLLDKEYGEYNNALHDNKVCSDWYLLQAIKKARINHKRYCCLNMAYHLIQDKEEKKKLKEDPEYINYDAVITYCHSQKSFGIPIHDGGSSFIAIKYCPWCSKKLDKYPIL